MADKTMDAYEERDAELDEELAEVLIAISVISKRLNKIILPYQLNSHHIKSTQPKLAECFLYFFLIILSYHLEHILFQRFIIRI